jgi:hypothetical protein
MFFISIILALAPFLGTFFEKVQRQHFFGRFFLKSAYQAE